QNSARMSPLLGHITSRSRDNCHARIVRGVSSSSASPDRDIASPGAASLARGVSATWWYTVAAVIFFELVLVLVWMAVLAAAGLGPGVVFGFAAGGLIWTASTVMLLIDYRHRADAAPGVPWVRLLAPML